MWPWCRAALPGLSHRQTASREPAAPLLWRPCSHTCSSHHSLSFLTTLSTAATSCHTLSTRCHKSMTFGRRKLTTLPPLYMHLGHHYRSSRSSQPWTKGAQFKMSCRKIFKLPPDRQATSSLEPAPTTLLTALQAGDEEGLFSFKNGDPRLKNQHCPENLILEV